MKNNFQSKTYPQGSRTLWRYLGALFILFTFAIGNVWGTSYIPGDCKVVTANETIDYATIAGANATTSGKWIVNPRGGTTSGKKYTNLTSDTKGNPDGIVDNIATITSNVNMATIQVPSTAKYNQSGKYVIHMRITGITGIIAHGVTGSSGRGCAIYGQEYSTSLTENTGYGSALASMTRSGNSGSFLLQYTGFTASKEYLITIAATGGDDQLYAIELIAGAATTYTVTYKPGAGSGPDVVDTDAKTVLDCPSAFSYSGYDFAGWKDADNNDVEVGANVTEDMTLTAQWTVHVDKYTVKYMDGATVLGTEQVNVNSTPVGLAEDPKKDCYTFAAWDPALNTISGEKNQVIEVSATWTAVYSSSATLISDDVKNNKPNVNTVFAASKIVSSITFDSKNYEFTSNETKKGYYGYKDKNSGDYMKILVQQGKQVKVLFGHLYADPTITANGATQSLDATRQTGDNVENTFTYKATSADALISITLGAPTNTLKSVTIEDIPAVDNDNTLKELKVGGVMVEGFSASTYTYYYEVPYGTAVENFPQITAVANSTKAKQVAIQQAVWTGEPYNCYRAQANVQAEDESWGYYDVRFYFGPKYGVELIKATHTGEHTATKAGYWKDDVTVDKTTQGGGKLGSNDHFFGLTLGNEKTFKAGDMVVIKASNISATVELFNTKTFTSKADSLNYIDKGNFDSHSKMYIYTLEADADKLYLYRTKTAGSSMNPTVDYIAVYRQMPAFIESFEIEGIGALTIDQVNKTITADVANTFDVTALTPTVKYWGNGGGAIDKTGAKDFTNPVQYTVSSAYSEDATGDYAPVTYTVTITKVVPSATPSITTQPASANYYEGASIAALEVVAESTVGELSYQWQVKNGPNYEDIEGATTASYTPAISAIGSYVYRVVVTNTEESKPATSVESSAATIEIVADPACATFVEASIPTEAPYQYSNTGEWTIYNASSSGKRNGSDQVFTNVKDFDGNTVKGYAKERCVLIFEKDMKQIRFYSANAQRSWGDTPVRVSDDVETFLGTGTPSYSEYAATTSIIQADPSNNKEQIFIADGEFLAGKCYWFAFSSSLQIFQICAVEADPLADAPVFNADLANEAICPGASFTTLDATAAPVTSYKWYKDGEVIENAEAATYTPTEAGTYYCIATNSADGYRNASTKSKEAVLSVNAVTAITTAPQNQRGIVDAVKTLSVVAAGANLTYAWYTCDDETGANPAVVPGATEASLQVTITAGMHQYYKVVVTGACGEDAAVALVEEWALVEQVDVTGYMKWDWNKTTNANAWNGVANIQLSGADKTKDTLMANTANTMPNNTYFRSDMLVTNGEYPARPTQDGGIFQGYAVKFHTTVPGKVVVTYRGTGANVNVNLVINNQEVGTEHDWHTKYVVVPAGDVTITEKEGGVLRIRSIEFVVEADHERDVVVGNMGTVCLPNPSRAFGVKVYELAGKGEGCKVQFDELGENEVLAAGKAYVLVMTDTKAKFFYTNTESPVTEADWTTAMKGNLNEETILFEPYAEAAKNVVFFKDNAMWNAYETGLKIKQYRAYLQYDEVAAPTSGPANGRRRVTLNLHQTEIATGFENLNASEKPVKLMIDGQIYILRGEKLYDATGRLVK